MTDPDELGRPAGEVIGLESGYEIDHWARLLACSVPELLTACYRVGCEVTLVRAHLARDPVGGPARRAGER